MEVTFYTGIRLIGINGQYYTADELEKKTGLSKIVNDARRIFGERKKKNPLYVSPFCPHREQSLA